MVAIPTYPRTGGLIETFHINEGGPAYTTENWIVMTSEIRNSEMFLYFSVLTAVSQSQLRVLGVVPAVRVESGEVQPEGGPEPHGVSGVVPHLSPAQGVDQDGQTPPVVHHEAQHLGQELSGCPHLKTAHWVRTPGPCVEVRHPAVVQPGQDIAGDSVADDRHVAGHHLHDDGVTQGQGLRRLLEVLLGPVDVEMILLDDLMAGLDIAAVIHPICTLHTARDEEDSQHVESG